MTKVLACQNNLTKVTKILHAEITKLRVADYNALF